MTRLRLFVPLIVFLVLVVFFLLTLLSGRDPQELPSVLVGKTIPEVDLPALQTGEMVSRDMMLGEPFLLNVWATWCPTCIHEHPFLMKLAERGVKIIGLNYKDENPKALAWLERLGDPYAFNIVDKEGRLGLDLGVYGAPETFIVDKDGTILYRHAGDLNERVWKSKLAPIYSGIASTSQ